MKYLKNISIRFIIAFFFLGGGLITGGIMSASAAGDCSREACNDANECQWYGNMTYCNDNDNGIGDDCDDGVCDERPVIEPTP